MSNKLNKNFVSDIDKFMTQKRSEIPLSESQKKEIAKHLAVAEKRDTAESDKK